MAAQLPAIAADTALRARKFEARYTGARAALDGVMGDEFHTRLNRLAALLLTKADNAARAIDDDGDGGDGGQYMRARGLEDAYLDAVALLKRAITVQFDGDEIRGAWTEGQG